MALIDKLTAIADAIRGKTGGTEALTLDQMATEIAGMETGGGGEDTLAARLTNTLTEYSNSEMTKLASNGFQGCTSLTSVNLPAVTEVGTYCFHGCSSLTSVNLPAVTTIGTFAFYGCTALESIDFPLVTSFGKNAFYYCKKLTDVNLPLLTYFDHQFFQNCDSLTKVDLPSAQVINTSVFQYCSALTELVLRRSDAICVLKNVSSFTGTPFESGGTGGTVYVPEALIESYQTATNWSTLYAAGTCNFVAIEGSEYE